MALQADIIKYVPRATYGSAAFDLERAIPYYDRPATEEEIPQSRPAVRTRKRAKAAVKVDEGISAFSVVGFVVIIALMMLILMSYIQFAALSEDVTNLEDSYSDLTKQEDKLKIEYESAFDVNAIEEYATGTLGMIKPYAYQMNTVNTQTSDKAEIIETQKQEEGIFGKISSFLSSITGIF